MLCFISVHCRIVPLLQNQGILLPVFAFGSWILILRTFGDSSEVVDCYTMLF